MLVLACPGVAVSRTSFRNQFLRLTTARHLSVKQPPFTAAARGRTEFSGLQVRCIAVNASAANAALDAGKVQQAYLSLQPVGTQHD